MKETFMNKNFMNIITYFVRKILQHKRSNEVGLLIFFSFFYFYELIQKQFKKYSTIKCT